MNDLELFNFEGNNVRTLEIDEEVYFVGKVLPKYWDMHVCKKQ